jgi:hypothetical protein
MNAAANTARSDSVFRASEFGHYRISRGLKATVRPPFSTPADLAYLPKNVKDLGL